MKGAIKRLFCRHKKSNEVVCWHWTHGEIGNEPIQIEAQLKCTECGKYHFLHIDDPKKYDEFASKYKDKQWSDTCQPVL